MALTLPVVTENLVPTIQGNSYGRTLYASPFALQASAANSKRIKIDGYTCAVYIFSAAATFVVDVYVSPDGGNFIKIGSITEATAVKRLDLGVAHSVILDMTAIAAVSTLTAVVYGEERRP